MYKMVILRGISKENKSLIKKIITIALAEFIGTAILVFISCMGGQNTILPSNNRHFSPIYSYLSAGLSVMIVMHLFGNISGAHVNPVTTICAIILNEISPSLSIAYFISEILGAVIGYRLLILVTPSPSKEVLLLGIHEPSRQISISQALFVEFLITLILVFANCSSWDKKNVNRSDSVALRFGLLVLAVNVAAGPYTGASMNPVRSFAPALWCNYWNSHWIYWIGPLSSAVIGSTFYKIFFYK